jgi:hypothetical protein
MVFKIFMVASADDPVVLRTQASVKTLWRSMRNFRFRGWNKCNFPEWRNKTAPERIRAPSIYGLDRSRLT